tara:strand:- start:43 stop:270 length:228 start_codon:yes stop_codon:yes gene_type:complete
MEHQDQFQGQDIFQVVVVDLLMQTQVNLQEVQVELAVVEQEVIEVVQQELQELLTLAEVVEVQVIQMLQVVADRA